MENTRVAWVLVADGEGARLLQVTATQHKKVHLDEVAKLASTFQAGDHERPTRLSKAGHSGPASNESERKLTHFGGQLAAWLAKELPARKITQCTLFAPSHLLGALRPQLGKAVAGLLVEKTGELAQFSIADLARHPGIVALLPA